MKVATRRFAELIGSFILFAATIFIYAVLLEPAYVEVNKLRGELFSERQVLEEQRTIVEKVKMALQQYQDLSKIADTISLVLPGKEAYPTLMNQLDTIAKSAGIFLDSVNLNTLAVFEAGTAAKKSPLPTTLQLTMNLIGPYSSFKEFLSKIETNVRLIDVVRFSVAPTAVGQNYSYSLVAHTYYQSL